MKKQCQDENGMVIIEASFVFPIMFIIIFVMIYTGNAYMQKCRVDAIVNEMAIKGAAYCADPLLEYVESNSSIPSVNDIDVKPYRYMIGGMNEIETKIEKDINSKLNNIDTGLFYNMKPKCEQPKIEFHNYFIYSTFSVELTYKIPIPIRLFADNDDLYLSISSRYDAPVSDVPEFIRNVNMVEDYMEAYGAIDKIQELVEEAKSFMGTKKGGIEE